MAKRGQLAASEQKAIARLCQLGEKIARSLRKPSTSRLQLDDRQYQRVDRKARARTRGKATGLVFYAAIIEAERV